MDSLYTISEFAGLAGVTIRALRHYERLHLLKPARSPAGYRRYQASDLETLEQILALKFIGFSLTDIKRLLKTRPASMLDALHAQREILQQKRRHIDRAIEAIAVTEQAFRLGSRPLSALTQLIEVLHMQNEPANLQQYHELVQQKLDAFRRRTPDDAARMRAQWTDLVREVEGHVGDDPASPAAQALADRWLVLLRETTGIDPSVVTGGPMAFFENAPPDSKKPEVWSFMRRALAARAPQTGAGG